MKRFPILVFATAVSLGSGIAHAFCRTTTCDTAEPPAECARNATDANGCSTLGMPLYWPGGCPWFGVQEDGSEKLGIPYETLHDTVKAAFGKWASADCGGGRHPSFEMTDTDELYGKAVCGEPEFSLKTANASVWAFRDGSWPYGSQDREIAITLIQAELSTGRIFDADVQLNSFGNQITTTNVDPKADLESIVTHEAGHFLGLAHSLDPDSTMNQFYSRSSTKIRELATDDVAGICAAYPPSGGSVVCGEPEPYFGFSKYCGGASPSTTPEATRRASIAYGGCAIGPGTGRFSFSAVLGMLATLAAIGGRRSRHRLSWLARSRPGEPRLRSWATARACRDS